MNSALGWFGELVGWLASWIPRLLIVRATHRAVKFKRGHKVVALKAGLHLYWPLVTEVVSIPSVRQTLNLPTQVIQCADNKTVSVSGVVVYSIQDVANAVAKSWEVDDTVEDLALTCILRALIGRRIPTLIQELKTGSLETKTTEALRKDLRRFGVYIQRCSLTDFATAKVVHLSGSAAVPVPETEDEE